MVSRPTSAYTGAVLAENIWGPMPPQVSNRGVDVEDTEWRAPKAGEWRR